MKARSMVRVDWIDSCSFGTQRWRESVESEQLAPSRIQTVGILVKETKNYITVTGSMDEEDHVSGCLTIPRGCITKLRRLK
jgi:hypothetical protein